MSTRLRNALMGEEMAIGISAPQTNIVYGMAQTIPGDNFNFMFSPNGLCDNWVVKRYSDVKSYQTLEAVRCLLDNQFYPYYKFEFI